VQSLEEDVAISDGTASATKSNAAGTGLGPLGTVAGVAAAGLGGAALAGGLAVDITDIAVIAAMYGVAQAVSSSRSAMVRETGAAGPLFSVLLTAADIAKKVHIGNTKGSRAIFEEDPSFKIGRYEKSKNADQSARSSGRFTGLKTAKPAPSPAAAAAATTGAAPSKESRVEAGIVRMRRQLGSAGMQALEDGVAQVMASDVERILRVCFNSARRLMSKEVMASHLTSRRFQPCPYCHVLIIVQDEKDQAVLHAMQPKHTNKPSHVAY
jgi:hypothetical protein